MARTPDAITEPFEPVMAEALRAYLLDPELACQMAEAAVRINHKRATWAVRKELRTASADAVSACAKLPQFTCSNPSPCGVGPGCKWSSGDLALLEIEAKPGRLSRPQPHQYGPGFDVEHAVQPLLALRTR